MEKSATRAGLLSIPYNDPQATAPSSAQQLRGTGQNRLCCTATDAGHLCPGARTDRWAKPDRAFKHFAMDQVHKAVSAHKLESSKARELGRKIYDTIVQREVEVRHSCSSSSSLIAPISPVL